MNKYVSYKLVGRMVSYAIPIFFDFKVADQLGEKKKNHQPDNYDGVKMKREKKEQTHVHFFFDKVHNWNIQSIKSVI